MLCANAPDVEDLADFGFLYGMVPTGPIVMLFAAEYGLRTEMVKFYQYFHDNVGILKRI